MVNAIVASDGGGSVAQHTQLNTETHPANQRFALGRARKLRVLTEEQLALFWENGCACASCKTLSLGYHSLRTANRSRRVLRMTNHASVSGGLLSGERSSCC